MRSLLTCVAALALLGGCTTKSDYDRLQAHLNRTNSDLATTKEALGRCELQNQRLTEDAASARRETNSMREQLAVESRQRVDLSARFNELKTQYEKVRNLPPEMPNLGDVVVLPSEVDLALKQFAKENPDLLEYFPKYGMIKFKSDLTFKPGSDNIQETAQTALGRLVTIVNSTPAAKFNIYIAGHTDNMPIAKPETKRRHPDNWYLSVHRSVAVQQGLVKAGLDPARIGVMGFSQYHPVVANAANDGGNQGNRRVEIWVVPPKMYLTQDSR
ncbi:MAG: OmpA family protein [Planctomycetaceae bacterium]|nr:OmpA family protein [Planctomycetaceae bacterium]